MCSLDGTHLFMIFCLSFGAEASMLTTVELGLGDGLGGGAVAVLTTLAVELGVGGDGEGQGGGDDESGDTHLEFCYWGFFGGQQDDCSV